MLFGKPVASNSRYYDNIAATGNGQPQQRPQQRSTRPIMTGSTVLGIVYDKGVLLAADTVLSYGSMAKVQNIPRIRKIAHANCLLGASGEYSDFQALIELLERKALQEESTGLLVRESVYPEPAPTETAAAAGGGAGGTPPPAASTSTVLSMSALQIWNYLRFVMYNRRNKYDPYWNELVVAGTYFDHEGKNGNKMEGTAIERPFLGTIDKIGTTIRGESVVATGFGSYLALPLLREQWRPDLTEGEARALLEDALKILFFRDCRASARVQLAKVEINSSSPSPTTSNDNNNNDGTQGPQPQPTPQPPTLIVSDPYDLDIPNSAWESPSFLETKGDLDNPTACGF